MNPLRRNARGVEVLMCGSRNKSRRFVILYSPMRFIKAGFRRIRSALRGNRNVALFNEFTIEDFVLFRAFAIQGFRSSREPRVEHKGAKTPRFERSEQRYLAALDSFFGEADLLGPFTEVIETLELKGVGSDSYFENRIIELNDCLDVQVSYSPKDHLMKQLEMGTDKSSQASILESLRRNRDLYIQRKMLLPTFTEIEKLKPYLSEPNLSLLDYGCGAGDVGLYYLLKGHSVTFSDINEGMLFFVKKRLEARSLSAGILEVDEEFDLSNVGSNSFDIINSIEVIEHLTNPIDTLEHFHRILKENGVLALGSFPFRHTSDHGDHVTSTVNARNEILALVLDKFELIDSGGLGTAIFILRKLPR